MGLSDFKLRYLIEGDNSSLKNAINEIEKKFKNLGGTWDTSAKGIQRGAKEAASEISNVVAALTGDRLTGASSQVTSLANAFGAIPGPAGLAVGAIAAVGVATVGVGGALFELTKKAEEYGSVIHDASDKTGLHAETLSAMDLAAKQSGTTLDQVTAALAKFAKNVSAGKDELKAFGITPQEAINDLDGSLAKVFKRIIDAKPGYEQIVLAQKAFGKSGADLLPFIHQFNGDLPNLIANAKKLGLTLSDEDARAADEFGDELTQLDAQASAAARTIGFELMPTALDFAKQFSSWLTDNKGEIKSWGDSLVTAVKAIGNAVAILVTDLQIADEWSAHLINTPKYYQLLDKLAVLEQKDKNFFNGSSIKSYSGVNDQVNELTTPYTPTAKPGPFPDFSEKGGSTKHVADKFKLSSDGKALVDAANKIGISPLDLATIIGFETAGTYSTSKTNSVGRFGLIQFGQSEASQYGASKGQTFERQLDAVTNYLVDRFKKAGVELSGANLLTLYKAVLAGSPSASGSTKDAYGTSAISGVRQMLLGGTQAAALNRFFGGKESNVPSDKNGRQLSEMEKAELAKQAKDYQEYWAFKKDIQKAGVDYLLTQAEREIEVVQQTGASYTDATQKASAVAALKKQLYDDEITALEELRDNTDDLGKKEEIRRQIELKTIEAQIAAIKITNEQHDSVVKLTSQYYDLAKGLEAAESATEQYMKENPYPESTTGTGSTRSVDRNFNAFDQMHKYFQDQGGFKGDLGVAAVDAATTAFQQLGDAVGSAVEAFVLYGNAGTSVRQVTAQILASIAQQAAVQAIYELAQGLAVLALAFFGVPNAGPSATMHFAAAATYGLVAGVTAVAGRAVAGNSFNKGGKGGSAGGAGGASSSGAINYNQDNINQHPTPYSRASDDAYISGSRSDRQTAAAIREHTELLRQFYGKIDSMPAHEIVTTAAKQRPGIIGRQVVRDISTHSDIGTNIRKGSGQRR